MTPDLPRVPLAVLPTPLEPLPRLSEALRGPRLFVKRDDLTGLAGGGNKTRKLEYVLAQAAAQDADTLVTVGALQSNHCRQTAAAAARHGLRCVVVLRGHPPEDVTGNLLLDHLLGARVVFSGDRPREQVMDEVVAEERAAGRRPYPIPLGASTPLGALGYVRAMLEVVEQAKAMRVSFERIIVASSSGGTQAGLILGARLAGFEGEVLGISVDLEKEALRARVADIATGAARLLGESHRFEAEAVSVNDDYLGGGYAVMGEPEREAIRTFARREGLLLDPVYTGRAAAGMLDLIRRGAIRPDETILFWHTGGIPALWAYRAGLAGG